MRSWLPGLLLLLVFSDGLVAQRTSSNRDRLLKQIELSHNLLKSTNEKQDQSIAALAALNNQIRLREDLIETYRAEVRDATADIDSLEARLCDIESEVQAIREEYAHLAGVTFRKLDNSNRLLYLLGARSLKEAYARITYFRQIGRHRKRQVSRLNAATREIRDEQNRISERIEARKALLASEQAELKRLEGNKAEHNSLYFSLKDKEEAYRDKLIRQRERLRNLLTAAEKKPTPKPDPKPEPAKTAPPTRPAAEPRPAAPVVTPEPAPEPVRIASTPALTGQFTQNRGRLPWPVTRDRAIVAGKFGPTRDAFGNRIVNDGVFLQTPQGEGVKAVFTGTITGVTEVPLSGTLVIMEHGKYRTAYAGLKNVTVEPGQKVTAGAPLGQVYTDGRTGETTLQFMVYRANNQFENPLSWLLQ